MNIGFIGPMPPDPGGIAQHGARLVEALRANHDVAVVSWASPYPRAGGRGFDEDSPVMSAERSLTWWNPWSWYQTGLRARKWDLVVVQYVHPFHAGAVGTIIRVARPTPSVALVHNVRPHEWFPFQGGLARWAMSRCSRVVAHSRHVGEIAGRALPGVPVEVIPHPPNLEVSRT
ncbi:MAG: glycosyltransferase, partial [Actinobacteria bacterium]|nr:glycosyltransferase [Actinomycetota bacterium]